MEEKYPMLHRDLSWLAFNHRVLQEAADPEVPLFERIKFIAIFSSNLDEFYRVRVPNIRKFKKDGITESRKPNPLLDEVIGKVETHQRELGQIFKNQILPELQQHGIHIAQSSDPFSEAQRQWLKSYYENHIEPDLRPILISEGATAPFLENGGTYLFIPFENQGSTYAILKIPSDTHDRFVPVPYNGTPHYVLYLDDLIRMNLKDLFPDYELEGAYAIKVSRDAELYVEDELSGDLVEKILTNVKNRDIGTPTRCLYDEFMPREHKKVLRKILKLRKRDMIPGGRYHNFSDFFHFPDPINKASLHDPHWPPLPHPELQKANSIFSVIRKKDQLISMPYQSFEYISRLVEQAAVDPNVTSIRITLYRVAKDSKIAQALLKATERGKNVTVFCEVKARFDEESNYFWGNTLKEKGANIIFSFPGIKVHTKILLITRKEKGREVFYSYLGTGNFNEKTARIYCDHGLLTFNQEIGRDVLQVFQILERKIIYPNPRHLFIAPFTLRNSFERLIGELIDRSKEGQHTYMICKMNSLEDSAMIERLYDAGRAGVRVQLIVRGICRIQPGIEGVSDNIEVRSIVDRFLEHARIYIFGTPEGERMYVASADWMTRNLDRRIEVAFPIFDPDVFKQIRDIIDLQLADNVKARVINKSQDNTYIRNDEPGVRAQEAIYKYLSSLDGE